MTTRPDATPGVAGVAGGSGDAAPRLPTVVVVGADARLRDRLIRQWFADRPADQRWAWVGGPVGDAGASGASVARPADRFEIAAGCACCIGGPALRVMLARVLQAGDWRRLIIEVEADGHPDRLVDQLRSPPFDRWLAVQATVLVTAPGEFAVYRGDGPPGPRAPAAVAAAALRLAFASDVLLASDPSVPGDDAAGDPFAALIEAAAPWPRLERVAGRRLRVAATTLPGEPPGWRRFSLLADDEDPDDGELRRDWPADIMMARRPAADLLARLANDSAVLGLQALLRTPRAWYCWRHGRARGAGPLAFDVGRELTGSETGWRFDNRVRLWLAAGARRRSVESRLAELDLAIQGPDGIVDPAVS